MEFIKGFMTNLLMWTGGIVLVCFIGLVIWYAVYMIISKSKEKKELEQPIEKDDNKPESAYNKLLRIKYRIAELSNSTSSIYNDDDYISLSNSELDYIVKILDEKAFYYNDRLESIIKKIFYYSSIYNNKDITEKDVSNKIDIVEKLLDIYRATYGTIYQNTNLEFEKMNELILKNNFNKDITISELILICSITDTIVDNSNWQSVISKSSEQLSIKTKLNKGF